MLTEEVIKKFKKECAARLDEMNEHLSSGKATDMNDYKRIVGVIRGINISLELLSDIIKNNEDEDFDEL